MYKKLNYQIQIRSYNVFIKKSKKVQVLFVLSENIEILDSDYFHDFRSKGINVIRVYVENGKSVRIFFFLININTINLCIVVSSYF